MAAQINKQVAKDSVKSAQRVAHEEKERKARIQIERMHYDGGRHSPSPDRYRSVMSFANGLEIITPLGPWCCPHLKIPDELTRLYFHVSCHGLPNVNIGMSAEIEAGVQTREIGGTCHVKAVASVHALHLVQQIDNSCANVEVCAYICMPAEGLACLCFELIATQSGCFVRKPGIA